MTIKDKLIKFADGLSPIKIFLATVLVFSVLFITNGVPYIFSDGYCYYHIARSVTDEGSFVMKNRPEYYDYRGHVVAYHEGVYKDVCAPGAGIVNVPGLLVSKLLRHSDQTIYTDYFMAANGHTILDGTMVMLTATVFALATLVILYRILRNLGFRKEISILTTAAIYLSSYAIWYVFLNAAYTHTYELFALSLNLLGFIKYQQTKKIKFLAFAGIGMGFALLVRPVILLGPVLFGLLILIRKDIKALVVYGGSAAPLVLLWMLYNYISYGTPITSGYNVIRTETFDFSQFNFFNVLFSPQRGLFVYSPVLLFGLFGSFWMVKKRKFSAINIVGIISVLGLAFVYGFWPAWWGGGSYGARFMIVAGIYLAPGLAYLLDNRKQFRLYLKRKKYNLNKVITSFIILSVLFSISLTLLYRVTPVAVLRPPSDKVGQMRSGDRYTPVDIFRYHIDLIRNADSPSGYFKELYSSFNGGNSYLVSILGLSDVILRIDERDQGKLKFLLLEPPVRKQTFPEELQFYLATKYNREIYNIYITNMGSSKEIEFDCDTKCSSSDERVKIELLDIPPQELSTNEYLGIDPDNYKFNLYFKNTYNLQVAGPLIRAEIAKSNYSLVRTND